MTEPAVRRLLDEQGIRDACMRYWAGVDQKDADLFGAAFTADAELSLFGGENVVKIADMIAGGRLSGGYAHTCHSLANQTVTVTGDTATATSFVVAHLIPDAGPILVRGLRYEDQLVRHGSGWRIARREHHTLWQYDAERVVPHLAGEPA
ncbi:nuclear transport factor 2 family protein [Amycolatopsis sp. GM8]|uniref:nuclear transport factor 2 family protein n=1 Tax=Amycolatopsis sp. GM8 TaxID=2896530 RepID=UPI001F1DD399|nr:nuclear transport factor 2 family protein [Amycolatopsis sp. GM8]